MPEKIGDSVLKKKPEEKGKEVGLFEIQQRMKQKQEQDKMIDRLIQEGYIPEQEKDEELGYGKEAYAEARRLMEQYGARNLRDLERKIEEARQLERQQTEDELVEGFRKPMREVKEVARARGVSLTTAEEMLRKEKKRRRPVEEIF